MTKHARWIAALIAMAALLAPMAIGPAPVWAKDAESAAGDAATEDVLVLDSGTEVHGQIIEETATEIVMDVEFRGMFTRTTYLKSEVLEIKRDQAMSGAAPARDANEPTKTREPNRKDDVERPAWVNEDTSLLYIAELEGFMGRDITTQPFDELFKDVDRQFNDLIDVPGGDGEQQVRSDKRDKHIVVLKMDCRTDPRRGFDGLFVAEQLAPAMQRERAKGRRIVFWVDNAGGGAAFLALMGPEIYMTREGWMGGVGTLDDFDIGDELVNEKQISLRLGHAEGWALYGGYGEVGVQIVRAMTRKQFWFAARLVGGKPEVLLEDPRENPDLHGGGWTILADDGKGDNADDPDALKGNDVLVLEADWAQKLGISRGVADDVDELAFALRIEKNFFELPETRAEKIMEGWHDEIENVIRQINPGDNGRPRGDLWVKFDDVPKFAKSPGQLLGRRIGILRQIHSLIGRYAEVFDPEAGWRAQIEIQIEQLKQEAERARQQNSAPSRGRGGTPVPR
ncbi:MAG: hypothetical protein KDA20_02350 [Phycisphaerales bacterium]|nr:hypothetical protein [Phycisphaerales bacterium]